MQYGVDTFDLSVLKGHFLIAMPGLRDPNFVRTVVLVCEHSDEGTLGLVVNRTLPMSMAEACAGMGLDTRGLEGYPVHLGGPVEPERGFVIHAPVGTYQSVLPVTGEIGVATSWDILNDLARGEGPAKVLFALGYAGWGPGQLAHEIAQDAWLVGPADPKIVFDVPLEERWEAAARLLGVDIRRLADRGGMA